MTGSDPVVTLGRFVDRLIPPGWRVLAVPDFRRLWLAHGGSVIGDGFHAIAITWLVFQTLGGGAQALVFLGIANLVPSLALGVLSGTIVDRLDRRRVMVGTDLIRAALVASLALLVASGMASIPIVIAMGTSLTIAALFFYPARNSVLAAYVAKEDLVPANALMQATAQGAQLLAPALGGVLFVAIRLVCWRSTPRRSCGRLSCSAASLLDRPCPDQSRDAHSSTKPPMVCVLSPGMPHRGSACSPVLPISCSPADPGG